MDAALAELDPLDAGLVTLMPLAEAAQAVQRSSFPGAYAADERGKYVTWLVCPHQEPPRPLHYMCDTGVWDLTLPDALAEMARRANTPPPPPGRPPMKEVVTATTRRAAQSTGGVTESQAPSDRRWPLMGSS